MIRPYEVHITIDPVFDPTKFMELKAIASKYLFRVAELFKKNGELNELDAFLTGRFIDFAQAKLQMQNCCCNLVDYGFIVRREKIELILHDERFK